MATISRTAGGTFDDLNWSNGVGPSATDIADAAGFVTNIDADLTCSYLSRTGTGYFVITGNCTINANIDPGWLDDTDSTNLSNGFVRLTASGLSVTVNGTIQNTHNNAALTRAVYSTGTGAVWTITGDIGGGTKNEDSYALELSGTNNLSTITGDLIAPDHSRSYALRIGHSQNNVDDHVLYGDILGSSVSLGSTQTVLLAGTTDGLTVCGTIFGTTGGAEVGAVRVSGAGAVNRVRCYRLYFSDDYQCPVDGRLEIVDPTITGLSLVGTGPAGSMSMVINGVRREVPVTVQAQQQSSATARNPRLTAQVPNGDLLTAPVYRNELLTARLITQRQQPLPENQPLTTKRDSGRLLTATRRPNNVLTAKGE